MDKNHMNKEVFFNLIEKRLFRYMDAIWGLGGWSVNIASAVHYNSEEMKKIYQMDDYIGNGFWGYGINRICDGKSLIDLPDVTDIEKIPELNKHHKPYRKLAVLTFKIENESLYVSTFLLDSVSVGVNAIVNTKYSLDSFENARVTKLNNKLHVQFIFKNLREPISFQLDDYHLPGYLCHDALARYYTEGLKRIARELNDGKKKSVWKDSEPLSDITNIGSRVHLTEANLRAIIAAELVNGTGKESFQDILPSDMKRTVQLRINESIGKDPSIRVEQYSSIKAAIQFCDIDHLKKLIISDRYWPFFENIFLDKGKIERYLEQFSSYRNSVMHNREVNTIVALEGEASIAWITSIQRRKEIT